MTYVPAQVYANDGFWQIRCDTCRIIYGHLATEEEATTQAAGHVHRIELSRKQVVQQRQAATSSNKQP